MTFRSEAEKRCAYAALDLAGDGKRLSRRAVAARAGMDLKTAHKMLSGLEARGLIKYRGGRPMFHGAIFKIYGLFSGATEGLSRRQ